MNQLVVPKKELFKAKEFNFMLWSTGEDNNLDFPILKDVTGEPFIKTVSGVHYIYDKDVLIKNESTSLISVVSKEVFEFLF